jgi:hypothetical protein
MKKLFLVLSIFVVCSAVYAQNRYALLIGNAKYKTQDPLPNTLNDIADVGKVLAELGYNVTLKSDLNRIDMVREINAFINRLSGNNNSEGFLWYGGHGIEIGGENYLMPLDVIVEDDSMIKATSYSVTMLTEELNRAHNKANVVVLDCCRAPPTGVGRGRGGDTTRLIKTVPNTPPDLLIIYSTESGKVAIEGDGKRNSPFAEAFLKNMRSTISIHTMITRVTRDTRDLTGGRQRPYSSGSIISDENYSLNPDGSRSTPSQAVGAISLTSEIAGEIIIDGQSTRIMIKANGTEIIHNVKTGDTQVAVKEENGAISAMQMIRVLQGQTVTAEIERPGNRLRDFQQRGGATQELKADGLCAAHPALPLSSRIRITNTSNGKEIEVTVVGRIPASPIRIVDLSPDAWSMLGLTNDNTVTLTVAR